MLLSSLKLIGNPVHHELTKHIRTQHHYVRELVANNEVALEYFPTDRMVADSRARKDALLCKRDELVRRKGHEVGRITQVLCASRLAPVLPPNAAPRERR